MSETNTAPGLAELKKFGISFAGVLVALFGVVIPLIRHGVALASWPLWPWFVAAVIGICALLHPAVLKLLYTPWMKFAGLAQWVNTRIIMLLLFYGVILPIGLVLRLFGKDSMRRRFEATTNSYRVPAETSDKDHMEKPY